MMTNDATLSPPLPASAPRRARRPVAALAALCLGIAACGPTEYLHPTYPVSGTVSQKGKPVAGAQVTFHPADPAAVAVPEGKVGPPVASPTVQSGRDGSFKMSTYYAHDGLPATNYNVTVVWAPITLSVQVPQDVSEDDTGLYGEYRPKTPPKDKLQGKYADPDKTPLKATVSSNGPNTFSFELD